MSIFKLLNERIIVTIITRKQYIMYLRKKGMQIGEGCDIAKSAFFGSEPYLIKIGDNVRITRGVEFITHDGSLWTLRKSGMINDNMDKFGPIVVGNNCNIGWHAIIMPGVTIGNNCIIGAGALVTKSVPDGCIVGGVPARIIETIDEYLEKNAKKMVPTKYLSDKEKKCYLKEKYPEWFKW